MKHKVFFDTDNEIIRFQTDGILYESDVPEFISEMKNSTNGNSNRQLLIEMDKNHKMENRKTRELVQEELENTEITEIAYVGANAAIRMIAKILLKTGNNKATGKFFNNNEEAIDWLKSKKQ